MKQLLTLIVIAALSGCGVGETAATAAAVGAGKAQEAKQAQNTKERFEQQFDAANQQTMDRLKAAESANQ